MKELDIYQELKSEKAKNIDLQQSLLLKEAYSIINGIKKKELISIENNSSGVILEKKVNLKATRIFSISDIKNVCINSRLRFLPITYYKSTLPYDAHVKCSAFEIEMGAPVTFKIITESQNFKAAHPNTEHLIFADLGCGEFYFITKWGNGYSKYRKLIVLPFRSIEIHLLSIFSLAFLFALTIPTKFLNTDHPVGYFSMIRLAFYFWCVIFLTAISTYYIIGIRKNLNSGEWNNSSFM